MALGLANETGVFDEYHRYPVIIGNIRIPLFFRFTQNPNYLKFSMSKEYEATRTIGGYVFEHWGKKPTIITGRVLIKKDNKLSGFISLNTKDSQFGIEDGIISPELLVFRTLFNIDQRKLKYSTGELISGAKDYVSSKLKSITGTKIARESEANNDLEIPKEQPVGNQSDVSSYISTMTDTIIYYKDCIYTGFFTKMSYSEDGTTPFSNTIDFEFLCTGTTYDWIDTLLTQTKTGRSISLALGATTSAFSLGSLAGNIFKK